MPLDSQHHFRESVELPTIVRQTSLSKNQRNTPSRLAARSFRQNSVAPLRKVRSIRRSTDQDGDNGNDSLDDHSHHPATNIRRVNSGNHLTVDGMLLAPAILQRDDPTRASVMSFRSRRSTRSRMVGCLLANLYSKGVTHAVMLKRKSPLIITPATFKWARCCCIRHINCTAISV